MHEGLVVSLLEDEQVGARDTYSPRDCPFGQRDASHYSIFHPKKGNDFVAFFSEKVVFDPVSQNDAFVDEGGLSQGQTVKEVLQHGVLSEKGNIAYRGIAKQLDHV